MTKELDRPRLNRVQSLLEDPSLWESEEERLEILTEFAKAEKIFRRENPREEQRVAGYRSLCYVFNMTRLALPDRVSEADYVKEAGRYAMLAMKHDKSQQDRYAAVTKHTEYLTNMVVGKAESFRRSIEESKENQLGHAGHPEPVAK